jgi:basic membrane protein A
MVRIPPSTPGDVSACSAHLASADDQCATVELCQSDDSMSRLSVGSSHTQLHEVTLSAYGVEATNGKHRNHKGDNSMKNNKFRALAISAIAASLLVAACGGSSDTADESSEAATEETTAEETTASAKSCDGQKVVLVSTQKSGDKSVVDDMIANGLNAAKDELGADTQLVDGPIDAAVFESTLTNAANSGANIIATTWLEMGEPAKLVAAKFPDVKFIHIYALPADPALPNLKTVSYRYDEATYLSGLVAASASSTKKLGYEAGMFVPGINTDYQAFKQAALTIDPSIEVLPGDVGSFQDDAKAKEVSLALYAKGADVIQNDGPVVGLVEAAKDKNQYAIIGAPGLVDTAPANIMGVTFIYFGKSLFDQIKAACEGTMEGGHSAVGVKEGVTGFYVPDQFIAAGDPAVVEKVQAAIPLVDKAIEDIKSGALVVPVNNDAP